MFNSNYCYPHFFIKPFASSESKDGNDPLLPEERVRVMGTTIGIHDIAIGIIGLEPAIIAAPPPSAIFEIRDEIKSVLESRRSGVSQNMKDE